MKILVLVTPKSLKLNPNRHLLWCEIEIRQLIKQFKKENAWNLRPTVDENAISCYLSADILTYLHSADKSSSLQMLTSFIVIKRSAGLRTSVRGSKERQSTNRYGSIFIFVCIIYKQCVRIKTSPIIDECNQMFTFSCFPGTSLFNVPVIRLFQLSADLTKTLKQPLKQRVVWKQT